MCCSGYTQLYRELNILPDVHIAEEARESGNLAIYEDIVSKPIQYSVMNDYKRSVKLDNSQPANLNGDTAVHWMLDIKQKLQASTDDFGMDEFGEISSEPPFDPLGYEGTIFDICEDMQIGEFESDPETKRMLATRSGLQLLYEPLPLDLPTVQKDLLILMAAYHGNVDRYVRLRRPKIIDAEIACCIRGIYHHTFFAVWWSKQSGEKPIGIEKAINARLIMNNVLSRTPFEDIHSPYLIWWPTVARESTYRQLAAIQPQMLLQIIRACIYAGYQDLFDELLHKVEPNDLNMVLSHEAEEQGNLHFRQALHARAKSLEMTISIAHPPWETWKRDISMYFNESSNEVQKYLGSNDIMTGSFYGQYDTVQCDASAIELNACLPDDWRLATDDEDLWRELDYEVWPPHSRPGAPGL